MMNANGCSTRYFANLLQALHEERDVLLLCHIDAGNGTPDGIDHRKLEGPLESLDAFLQLAVSFANDTGARMKTRFVGSSSRARQSCALLRAPSAKPTSSLRPSGVAEGQAGLIRARACHAGCEQAQSSEQAWQAESNVDAARKRE
jgi:hypothetical protein